MANNTSNPEDLHLIGQGSKSPTSPAFRTPGVPAAPLVKMSDLINPEISKDASNKLMDGIPNMAPTQHGG